MKHFNSKIHIFWILLISLLWVAVYRFAISINAIQVLSRSIFIIFATPYLGLVHGLTVAVSIESSASCSFLRKSCFVGSSGLLSGVVGVMSALFLEYGFDSFNISEAASALSSFCFGSVLGAISYIVLIRLMLPIYISLKRSFFLCLFSLFCLIPICLHYIYSPHEALTASGFLFFEPLLWWLGVSLALVILPNESGDFGALAKAGKPDENEVSENH